MKVGTGPGIVDVRVTLEMAEWTRFYVESGTEFGKDSAEGVTGRGRGVVDEIAIVGRGVGMGRSRRAVVFGSQGGCCACARDGRAAAAVDVDSGAREARSRRGCRFTTNR